MTIQTQDLVIYKSDTMDDSPQGGGHPTGNVIVGGESNNMFDDVSTLDRAHGAVAMRKIIPSVKTQDTDKYFGAHVILSKIPKDEQIGVNMFPTGSWSDRRPEAANRIENYLAKGANYNL